MIVIALARERYLADEERETDALRRRRIGYSPAMSPFELFESNRGMWVISPERARSERYALFVTSQDWIGQLAVEISHIEKRWHPAASAERSVIHGRIMHDGEPIHDAYVGEPCPLPPQRNPLRYFNAPEEEAPDTTCRCGCGEGAPLGRKYRPGHDQTALHDRVKLIGSVEDFLDWFDALVKPFNRV